MLADCMGDRSRIEVQLGSDRIATIFVCEAQLIDVTQLVVWKTLMATNVDVSNMVNVLSRQPTPIYRNFESY
jgi:hypothetical protein